MANTDFKEAVHSYNKGEYEQSKGQLLELIKLNNKNPEYYLYLGHVYAKLHQFKEAHESYDKVLEFKSEDGPLASYSHAKAAYDAADYTRAKDYLSGLAIYKNLPPKIKEMAEALHKKILTQEKILKDKEKK
jgi:predicted Zn-dependent protease